MAIAMAMHLSMLLPVTGLESEVVTERPSTGSPIEGREEEE